MAVNSDKCKSKCVSKARRNGLAALNPAVHIILSAGVNCYAKGANTMHVCSKGYFDEFVWPKAEFGTYGFVIKH